MDQHSLNEDWEPVVAGRNGKVNIGNEMEDRMMEDADNLEK